jgi:hypothetical protein
VGRLLGDPEVWDDGPSRPRVLLRGLVGLGAGLVAGGRVAFAVVPRPQVRLVDGRPTPPDPPGGSPGPGQAGGPVA